MKSQKGFTLIELIVVIVILGILAVSAAPKFVDLQSDARAAALNGFAGALKSAVQMVKSKAILQGKEKGTTQLCLSGNDVDTCPDSDLIDIEGGMPIIRYSVEKFRPNISKIIDGFDDSFKMTCPGPGEVVFITLKELDFPSSYPIYFPTDVTPETNLCGIFYTYYSGKIGVATAGC